MWNRSRPRNSYQYCLRINDGLRQRYVLDVVEGYISLRFYQLLKDNFIKTCDLCYSGPRVPYLIWSWSIRQHIASYSKSCTYCSDELVGGVQRTWARQQIKFDQPGTMFNIKKKVNINFMNTQKRPTQTPYLHLWYILKTTSYCSMPKTHLGSQFLIKDDSTKLYSH